MIDLNKELKTLRGITYPMSYPTKYDIETVKEQKRIEQVTNDDLPRETVKNVLINCLANYPVVDKKETFNVQAVATWINDESEDKADLPERLKNFITKQVLPEMTLRRVEAVGNEPAKEKGLYLSWVIAQVYDALGEKPE